jgi:hypothetical protein
MPFQFGQCCPHRFLEFLKNRGNGEKSSPLGGNVAKEQQTILTGLGANNGAFAAANTKLVN